MRLRRIVPDVVGDDAVVARIEAGDDRVVVGERLRGERRDQPLRADAAGHQPLQVRRRRPRVIVPAPAVEGNEDDRRLEAARLLRPRRGHGEDRTSQQQEENDAPHPLSLSILRSQIPTAGPRITNHESKMVCGLQSRHGVAVCAAGGPAPGHRRPPSRPRRSPNVRWRWSPSSTASSIPSPPST